MSCDNWFRNTVMYQILIDRFAGFSSYKNCNKPVFIGGNIRGIIDKISYLKALGINSIWISPFYKTNAYHITDFYDVDPHFGTKDDLRDLIKNLHDENIRIIADFVANHCSIYHPYFHDALKYKNSKYKYWFYFKNWPDDYLCFLKFREIPKINLDYPEAREHIINSALYWLSFGFDGFRLDHVIGPSHDFWNDFVKRVKNDFPHIILLGEAWMMGIKYDELKTIKMKGKLLKWFFGSSSDFLLKSYTNLFDGVLDFPAQHIIKKLICGKNLVEKYDILNVLKLHYNKYLNNYHLAIFLDNHDMNRFLFDCGNDKSKLRKAAEVQFLTNQPKIIYYGTEIGMSQEKSIWSEKSHSDIYSRYAMQWNNIDEALLLFYQSLISNYKTKF